MIQIPVKKECPEISIAVALEVSVIPYTCVQGGRKLRGNLYQYEVQHRFWDENTYFLACLCLACVDDDDDDDDEDDVMHLMDFDPLRPPPQGKKIDFISQPHQPPPLSKTKSIIGPNSAPNIC